MKVERYALLSLCFHLPIKISPKDTKSLPFRKGVALCPHYPNLHTAASMDLTTSSWSARIGMKKEENHHEEAVGSSGVTSCAEDKADCDTMSVKGPRTPQLVPQCLKEE